MVTLEYGDNMNKKIIGSIILVILTIVVFYFLVKDNYQEIFNSIINSNIYFLLLGFLLTFVTFFTSAITCTPTFPFICLIMSNKLI